MSESDSYCMVLTTCPSKEEANNIAKLLIKGRLAACVQITGITSHYEWEGEVNEENELLLFIKALSRNYEKIEDCIIRNHSYEVPEIVQIPITRGSGSYLKWIDEVSE